MTETAPAFYTNTQVMQRSPINTSVQMFGVGTTTSVAHIFGRVKRCGNKETKTDLDVGHVLIEHTGSSHIMRTGPTWLSGAAGSRAHRHEAAL